jgi:fructose transport system ATP-binding protein
VQLRTPLEAREAGIETVYQTLAVSPALDIADNLYLGRERRARGFTGKVLRRLDKKRMRTEARHRLNDLGITTIQDITQKVESLSGGQRQGVAVARAAAFAQRLIILDEPTAALGVKESSHVLDLILRVRENGLAVILISHNMPHVFELADRIHIHRLGRRIAVVTPKTHSMSDVVAVMTGAAQPDEPPGESPEQGRRPPAVHVGRGRDDERRGQQ